MLNKETVDKYNLENPPINMGLKSLIFNENYDWLNTLPALKKDEFFIEIPFCGKNILFCVRELTWPESLTIESQSFRKNDNEQEYFAGEYERREILNRAIVWVADPSVQHLQTNEDGLLTKKLSQEIVELLWPEYQAIVSLSIEEANALYLSTQKYFKGEAQNSYPVPPLVIEVDYMLKNMVCFSREEFRSLSTSDLERLQLILSARADCLGLSNAFTNDSNFRPQSQPQSEEDNQMAQDLIDTLPPHMRGIKLKEL